MYEASRNGSSDRLAQASALLHLIRISDAGMDSAESAKVQKGIFFVLLYAALEFTVTSVVSEFLAAIKKEEKRNSDFKMYYLGVTLHSEFKSLMSAGDKTVWQKKASLIDKLYSDTPAIIDESVFPTNGSNIAYDQLEYLWKVFHLPGSILPVGVEIYHLTELRDHRNSIAHGREVCSSIGRRFTSDALVERLGLIELLCGHILSAFEEVFKEKLYLR